MVEDDAVEDDAVEDDVVEDADAAECIENAVCLDAEVEGEFIPSIVTTG